MMLEKAARVITEALYVSFGSSMGHLFGLEPKHRIVVHSIVKLTLEALEWRESEEEEEEGS